MLEPPRLGEAGGEAVLTSTHNVCFGSKIRKLDTPANPSLTKEGFKGVYITRTCFLDVCSNTCLGYASTIGITLMC